MASATPPRPTEVRAEQVERFEFTVQFPGTSFPAIRVDEPAPVGTDRGPNPVRLLAASIGHCMSSTLYNCLERSRVAAAPVTTTVRVEVGRNPRGRWRVLHLDLAIQTDALHEEDRERFRHCVETFEDFCTVSGAVREGIPIKTVVRPAGPGIPDGSVG